jgi:hypothetical protein
MNTMDLELGNGQMLNEVAGTGYVRSRKRNYPSVEKHSDISGADCQKKFNLGELDEDGLIKCLKDVEQAEKDAKRAKRQEAYGKASSWLTNISQAISDYGATRDGKGVREAREGSGSGSGGGAPQPDTSVTILGMSPLVFSVVAITVAVGLGVAISRIAKK